MSPAIYRAALKQCYDALLRNDGAKGLERIIHNALLAQLPNASSEVKLTDVGSIQAWSNSKGRIDIVSGKHGIELKVVRLPRLTNLSPSRSLYDLGQLSSDYWRIRRAKKLRSGELVVLLHGPLVRDLPEAAISREFHNRMYVDFITSSTFGELSHEWLSNETPNIKMQRKRQIEAIKLMGFHRPYDGKSRLPTVRENEFALLSVPVRKRD